MGNSFPSAMRRVSILGTHYVLRYSLGTCWQSVEGFNRIR